MQNLGHEEEEEEECGGGADESGLWNSRRDDDRGRRMSLTCQDSYRYKRCLSR